MDSNLPIGRLAANAGVNVETIRYYQRRGLLSEPHKPLNGHRRYPAESVKRVRFIKRAQVLGFTLDEIAGLLQLDLTHACAETRDLAARKLQIIEQKLADLTAMRKALAKLTRQCDSLDGTGACPIIDALATD
ncbi:MAG: Hg(II)-responsive transcriptional regulator [Burkholderiaceae bacterium]